MVNHDSALARAKRPRSILAGPYGHPFHPIAITIPVGAWAASLIFDVIGFFAEDPEPYVQGANVLIGIGLVGAVIAAVLGLMDLSTLAPGSTARRTALVHMTLNLAAVALFVVSLIVRIASDEDDEVSVFGFILSLVAYAVVGASGYLGGKLAYHFGVRVADEGTQSEGFRDTR